MPPVDPQSGFSGIRLSPDAVIDKHSKINRLLRYFSGTNVDCTPSVLLSLAEAYREKKDFNRAEKLLKTLLSGVTKRRAEDMEHFRKALFLLGLCCHSREKYREAAGWYHLYLEHPLNDIFWGALARGNMADVYSALGRYDEAEALFRESLDILRPMFSQAFPSCPYYRMLENHALLLSRMNREEEAKAVKKEAEDEADLFWNCWVRCT